MTKRDRSPHPPTSTPTTTLYDVLEVSPLASAPVIKAAYRCLAQLNHPDKHDGAESAVERLANINQAYAILSDAQARIRYDATLKLSNPQLDRRGMPATAPIYTQQAKAATPAARPHGAREHSRQFAFRPLK